MKSDRGRWTVGMNRPTRARLALPLMVWLLWLPIGCGNGKADGSDQPDTPTMAERVGIQEMARTGIRAPEGQGQVVGLDSPRLNSRGDLLFAAEIDAPRTDVYDGAVLLLTADGTLRQRLRTGQTLPDGERFGWLMQSPDQLALNEAGQVAVWLTTDAEWNERHAMYRIDGNGAIISLFNAAEYGATYLGMPLINGHGQVAFEVIVKGQHGRMQDGWAYRVDGDGTRTRLFGAGDATPDGHYRLSASNRLGSTLNDDGWVSFLAAPDPIEPGDGPTHAFYRSNGGGLVELARRGEPAAAPGERIEALHHVHYSALDTERRTVFQARTRGAGGTSTVGTLFMHTDTGLVILARQGDEAPGGGRFERVGGVSSSINDRGEVAFRAILADGRAGIYVASSDGTLQAIAVSGQVLADGGSLGRSLGLPVINAHGQVAFDASTDSGDRAIILGQAGSEPQVVVREGQALSGLRVMNLGFAANRPGRSGFNDLGQIAFLARLEDDEQDIQAIFIAHP
jgi:hypothetical protein